MYHREYHFPAVCTGSAPGEGVGLRSGFAQCLLAAVPRGCGFPEVPPKENDHVGSGAEKDIPDSASEMCQTHL